MRSGLLPSNTHERYRRKDINSATLSEFFYNYTMCAFCKNLINGTGSWHGLPSAHRSIQLSLRERPNRKVTTPCNHLEGGE